MSEQEEIVTSGVGKGQWKPIKREQEEIEWKGLWVDCLMANDDETLSLNQIMHMSIVAFTRLSGRHQQEWTEYLEWWAKLYRDFADGNITIDEAIERSKSAPKLQPSN